MKQVSAHCDVGNQVPWVSALRLPPSRLYCRPSLRCDSKILYESEAAAQAACDSYHYRVSMVFAPMRPYWCRHHWGWHTGHDRLAHEFAHYASCCAHRHELRLVIRGLDIAAQALENIVEEDYVSI